MAATRTALKNFPGIRASARTLCLAVIVLLGLVETAGAQLNNAQKALQLPTEYAMGTLTRSPARRHRGWREASTMQRVKSQAGEMGFLHRHSEPIAQAI